MAASLQALVFDVDGTLADTERDGHRVAFNAAFADFGLRWRWSVARYGDLLAVPGGRERLLHFFDQERIPLSAGERNGLARDLHARKTRHYLERVGQGAIGWRQGVLRVIAEARAAGLRLAIATTTTRANVDALLARAPRNLGQAFEVIGAAGDCARLKPDPGIYHHVLARLGLAAADCLAIEDSASGLAAARGAGIATVVTRNPYTRNQRFDGALAVLDGLGEPTQPARWLGGSPHRLCVDIDQLRRWHATASNPRHATVT
jgi:beta-phosphoglucomutase-like phosphatase (HAD superfamily)